jgi:hypothetical protein
VRGNIRSRLSAARHQIGHTAMQQAMLLPPEVFHRRDGSPLTQTEVQRAMVVIITLDKCLKSVPRLQTSYTPGLIADAAAVVDLELHRDDLDRFYYWVAENREHPGMPRTAEEVLREFERLYPMCRR